MSAVRTMAAKYPGTCEICRGRFAAGEPISYNGRASHVACVAASLEADRAADELRSAQFAEDAAEFKAGLRVRSRFEATEGDPGRWEIYVTGACDYAMARAEAQAFVCSVRAAGGAARLLGHTRSDKPGKRFVGREVRSGGGYWGGMTYHEGWTFPVRVAA